jgi:protein-S-isoprenylcysteine O-methyltransferase Ste14
VLDDPFQLVWLIGFLAGSVIRAVYARRNKSAEVDRHRRTALDLTLVTITTLGLIVLPVVYLATDWLDFADYGLPSRAHQTAGWLGAAVFAVALWLLWRSHVDLGSNWSAFPEIRSDHSLVTEGVYRSIRHPMYTAHWLWAVAQMLLLQNWIAGPALAVFFLPFCLVRIPYEERMMLDRFGDEYRAYMDRTGRIVPRLWG